MNYLMLISVILSYCLPIQFLFGIIGNIMAFLVFSRKKFKKTIFENYFRLLIITNSIIPLNEINLFLDNIFHIKLHSISYFICKTRLYINFALCPIGAWILVIVSLDQMINIKYPSKFSFKNKKKFQYLISAILIIVNFALYIPIIIETKYQTIFMVNNVTNQTDVIHKCNLDDKSIVGLLWFDLFNSAFIPFSLMFVFSLISVIRLFQSRLSASNRLSPRDIRFAYVTLSFNFIFLVLNLPIVSVNIIATYININPDILNIIYIIVIMLFDSFCGIFFYLNFITNSLFKNEFFKLINYKK
jgi:hypothetical protein